MSVEEKGYPCEYEDEIDLVELMKVVWRRRWFIVGGVVLSMCVATVLVFVMPKVYRSKGFYKLSASELGKAGIFNPVVSQPEFNSLSTRLNNEQSFSNFLAKVGKADLSKLLVKRSVVPVYAFAGKKTRRTRVGRGDYVTGVELSVDASSAKGAFEIASLFGRWIGYCAIRTKLEGLVKASYLDALHRLEGLRIDLNKKRSSLGELKRGFSELNKASKGIMKGIGKDQKTLVLMKLVSIQEQIINLESSIASEELDYRCNQLKADLFAKLKARLDNETDTVLGVDLLNDMERFKTSYFTALGSENEVVNMVNDELTYIFAKVKEYSASLGFVGGPSRPSVPIKPRKKMILALSFVLSVLVFIFLAFILEWWSANKEEFKS